jgi:RND family efflux transporter MFP subunit
VRAVQVREGVRDAGVRAVGVLRPKDELRLGFKIGGVIERITVEEGDSVLRGTTLAELDRTEIAASVERAAQAVDKAARDLARAQSLYRDNVAPRERVENLTTVLNIAKADLDATRFNERYARIESPANGIVLRRLADPSELVEGGAPVIILGGLENGWSVSVAVTDRDIVQLGIGDSARVRMDAFQGDVFAARIERSATASDPATGTYEVELAIDPEGRPFVEGLVAKVELDLQSRARLRLWLPVEALVEANGSYATVFVLAGQGKDDSAPVAGGAASERVGLRAYAGYPHVSEAVRRSASDGDGPPDRWTVERRRIKIGALVTGSVEVHEGVLAGEWVVTDGAAWLEDGAPVTLAPRLN